MKVRLYMDVPPYAQPSWIYYAISNPDPNIAEGFKRVMFDVEIPTKDADEIVKASSTLEVK